MNKVTASFIFYSDGYKVLGTSRRNKPDEWGLPGGKLEPRETEIQAAIRETIEETGYYFRPEDLVLMYEGTEPVDGRLVQTYYAKKTSIQMGKSNRNKHNC